MTQLSPLFLQYSPEKTSRIESLEAESGLERTLREHDEEMISRYNSDIDTLLVFVSTWICCQSKV